MQADDVEGRDAKIAQLQALMRLLVDDGYMTPEAVRQINRVLGET